MRLCDGFTLSTLFDTPFILPYGQQITDQKAAMQTNETGALVFQLLQNTSDFESIVHHISAHYEVSEELMPQIRQDITNFLQMLKHRGILLENAPQYHAFSKPEACFQIGRIIIRYSGDERFLHPFLHHFSTDEDESGYNPAANIQAPHCDMPGLLLSDASISIQSWRLHTLDELTNETGKLILCSRQMDIYETADSYLLRFIPNHHLILCQLSKDGSLADFYYDSSLSQKGIDELFYGFRTAFLYFAQIKGYYALHSASLLYREKAWLFSASSGTGKSTHTNLWKSLYNVTLLNGDINLVSCDGNDLTVWGIPWCGTSGIFTVTSYPLGGIILLKRAPENHIDELSNYIKQLLVSQRMISPTWTLEQLNSNLSFAKTIAIFSHVCRLYCNIDPQSAEIMKEYIDQIEN